MSIRKAPHIVHLAPPSSLFTVVVTIVQGLNGRLENFSLQKLGGHAEGGLTRPVGEPEESVGRAPAPMCYTQRLLNERLRPSLS